jgi:hypothetical protein
MALGLFSANDPFLVSTASYGLARIPGLNFIAFVFEAIFWIDIPISIPLVVWNPEFLAVAWIVVVGTAWWYLLSLEVEAPLKRSKHSDGLLAG